MQDFFRKKTRAKRKKTALMALFLSFAIGLSMFPEMIAFAGDWRSLDHRAEEISGDNDDENEDEISEPIETGETTGTFRSWVRDSAEDEREYVSGNPQKADDNNKEKPGSVERALSSLIVTVARVINWALYNGEIDASTTGIIMGNVTQANGAGVPYFFVFDLSDNNVYGVLGAIIYIVARSIMVGFLFIIVLYSLVKVLWSSQAGKDFAALKETIYAAIIAMVFLFIMPQIVDWLCNIRDAMQVIIYKMMTEGVSGVSSTFTGNIDGPGRSGRGSDASSLLGMTEKYYELWKTGGDASWAAKSLPYGLIYFAFCVIPFFYMASYIKIAIEQAILFGTFPAFCVLGVRNKSIFSNWLVTFATNVFVPVFDILIISLPMILRNLITSKGVDESSFIMTIIIIVTMTAAIPARNKLIQMLGAGFGVQTGGELFGFISNIGARLHDGFKGMLRSGAAMGGRGGTVDEEKLGRDDVATAEDAARADSKDLADQMKQLNDVSGMSKADSGVAAQDKDGRPQVLTDMNDDLKTDGSIQADVNAEDRTGAPGAPGESVSAAGDDSVPNDTVQANMDVNADATSNTGTDSNVSGEDSELATESTISSQQTQLEEAEQMTGGDDATPLSVNEQMQNSESSASNEQDTSITNTENNSDEHSEQSLSSQKKNVQDNDLETNDNNTHVEQALSGEQLADVRAQGMVSDPRLQAEINKNTDYQMGRKPLKGESRQEFEAKKAETRNNMINRASNLESMGRLSRRSDALKADSAAARERQATKKADIDRFNRDIAALNKENKELDNKSSTGVMLSNGQTASQAKLNENSRKLEELQRKRDLAQANFDVEQQRINKNDKELNGIQSEMARRKDLEQGFAMASERAGHSNRAYDNADEYRRALAAENRRHEVANYQNYQSKEVAGVLSSRERQAYQAAASRRAMVKTIGTYAGKSAGMVAGAAVGGVVSLGAAYGGENSVHTAASLAVDRGVTYGGAVGGAVGGAATGAAYNAGARYGEAHGATRYNVDSAPSAQERSQAAMEERYSEHYEREAQAVAAEKRAAEKQARQAASQAAFKKRQARRNHEAAYKNDYQVPESKITGNIFDNQNSISEGTKQNIENQHKMLDNQSKMREQAENEATKGYTSAFNKNGGNGGK